MNLSELQTFIAIEQTGSLVKASRQLHVSQSTVTARLKALESELGQTLFQRNKSGVQMTAAGSKFRRYAETMTDLWRQAKQDTSLSAGVGSVMNLGCQYDLWPFVGCPLLERLNSKFPDVAFSAWPGRAEDMDNWLDTSLIDAALTYRANGHDDQNIHELFEETLILVSDREDTPMRFDHQYIYVDAGEEFGRYHTAAYSDAGVAKFSFGNAQWALDYLGCRGGSAYLPKQMVQSKIQSGELFQIMDAPQFTRTAYLVTQAEMEESWVWFEKVLDWIRALCNKTINSGNGIQGSV